MDLYSLVVLTEGVHAVAHLSYTRAEGVKVRHDGFFVSDGHSGTLRVAQHRAGPLHRGRVGAGPGVTLTAASYTHTPIGRNTRMGLYNCVFF